MDISGPVGRRVVAAAVVLVTAVAAAAAVVLVVGRPAPSGPTTPAPPVAVIAPSAGRVGVLPAVSSLAILRDWDRARARAWERSDPAALRALYVPGSAAGRADVVMLRRWAERGVRVESMAMQVLAVELRRRTPDRLLLVVTDRLVVRRAVVVGSSGPGRGAVGVPRDEPDRRLLELRRAGRRWLLASVRGVGCCRDHTGRN